MARGPIPDFPSDRPSVPEAIAAIRAYRAEPGNSVGGSLHIVIADQNLSSGHIRWCADQAQAVGDEAGARLATMLLAMTPTQRRKAVCSS